MGVKKITNANNFLLRTSQYLINDNLIEFKKSDT
jgi:hypothetical protein